MYIYGWLRPLGRFSRQHPYVCGNRGRGTEVELGYFVFCGVYIDPLDTKDWLETLPLYLCQLWKLFTYNWTILGGKRQTIAFPPFMLFFFWGGEGGSGRQVLMYFRTYLGDD